MNQWKEKSPWESVSSVQIYFCKKPGKILPQRSDKQAHWSHCGAVHECRKLSDCGTSHLPPCQSVKHSPVYKHIIILKKKKKYIEMWKKHHNFPLKRCKQMNFKHQICCNLTELLYSSCFHLWVDTEVFSWGKGQSQEVVAFSSLLGIKLQQLPQLLHNLQKTKDIYKIFRKYILEAALFLYPAERKQWKTSCDLSYRSNQ